VRIRPGPTPLWRPALVCLVLAALPAGCGGGSSSSSTARTATRETADAPATSPRGWSRLVNDAAGFSLSLPPGWAARRSHGGSSLIRSTDRALAVSISADRSDDGAKNAPAAYVGRTVRSLRGYGDLRAGRATAVPGLRYPAASVSATGTFQQTRVRQAITLYTLQRPGLVTYTLAIFRSARTPASRYAPYLQGLLRSFRGRPAQA
jgi:hypothetical protein